MVETINYAKYQEVIQKGNVLVVLGSIWCKDCVRIEPFIKELQETYQKQVSIYKIDTRVEEELSTQLGIRAIPTLIFYRNGEEIGKRLIEPQTKALIEDELKTNFSL